MPEPNSFQAIGWVSVAIVSLFISINQGFKFWCNIKDKPAPSEVLDRVQANYVSKTDFFAVKEASRNSVQRGEMDKHIEQARADHAAIFAEMKMVGVHFGERIDEVRRQLLAMEVSRNIQLTDLRKEIKEDIRGVHLRVNDILEKVAELRGPRA